MNDGNPTGEVRPMIDREPPNAAEMRGASPTKRFCATLGLVPALAALPSALKRRIVGLPEPASGQSRLASRNLNQVARSAPLRFSIMPGHPVGRSVGLPPNVNVTPAEVSMGGGPRATAGSIALQPIAHRADEVIE